ncbi:MAG: hypothetical protein ACYCYI_14010 [Saccharofermentanales bacterium]
MNIKSNTTIMISTAIVLAGILITNITGLWATESTKIPRKLGAGQIFRSLSSSASSLSSPLSQSSIEYDPADIKGSYTFSEISDLYKISVENLATAFMIEENAINTFKCKDVKANFADAPNEIGTASVRLFVSLYYGLDYESAEDVYLPESAATILKENSRMTKEQLEYLESHTITMP